MSRWIGILDVVEGPFVDRTPIFVPENDPFVIRFRVTPRIWLPLPETVPMEIPEIFSHLTFTRDVAPGGYWLGPLRRSLQTIVPEDAQLLRTVLECQTRDHVRYPIDMERYEKFLKRRIPRPDGSVAVSVPEDVEEETSVEVPASHERESIRIQADLCRIGEAMGLRIWLPNADRSRVLEHWHPQGDVLLDRLPLNYDETTLDTIQRIDVLWLKGRAIRRAFEIEHTTAIYSGLLRMADLCALLPNINVALHIVAPEARRDKVFQEITRPVFSLLEHAPLSERCTYLSYGSIKELASLEFLAHTTDSVLEEFVEHAE
jgi:hypothetical protein